MAAANQWFFYVRNDQKDIIGLIDAAGNLVVEYKYDAWGRILSIAGSKASDIGKRTPFRYRGYYYDEETGMYYLKSRYYDPELKRFISADETDVLKVQTDLYDKNLYSYCDNNPIARVDTGGELWELAVAYTSNKAFNSSKHRKGVSGRSGLKKQGREGFEKKKGDNWEKRSGKKPRTQPRPHQPSKKGHRKY